MRRQCTDGQLARIKGFIRENTFGLAALQCICLAPSARVVASARCVVYGRRLACDLLLKFYACCAPDLTLLSPCARTNPYRYSVRRNVLNNTVESVQRGAHANIKPHPT